MPTVSTHQTAPFAGPIAGTTNRAADVLANDEALRVAGNAHDADATLHVQSSALASRPAAAVVGRVWVVSDASPAPRAYYDTGGAWTEIGYLPLAGGTVTGGVTVTTSVGASGLVLGADPGGSAPLRNAGASWLVGRVLVGASDPGGAAALAVAGDVQGTGRHYSASGTASATSGVATNLVTITTPGIYAISALVAGLSNSVYAVVCWTGTTFSVIANTANGVTLGLLGSGQVQGTQSIGSTQTLTWAYTRLA